MKPSARLPGFYFDDQKLSATNSYEIYLPNTTAPIPFNDFIPEVSKPSGSKALPRATNSNIMRSV
jgi:hypothetical protein